MDKIWLVIKREFSTRVRTKQFIIITLLGPLLFTLPILVTFFAFKMADERQTVYVVDQSGYFEDRLESTKSLEFEFKNAPPEALKEAIKKKKDVGLLVIPEHLDINQPLGISYYSENPLGPLHEGYIRNTIKKEIEEAKLQSTGMRRSFIDSLKADVSLASYRLTDEGEKKSNSSIASILGIVAGMVMYFFIFLYGMMVLRGVVEEKSSRIVEVIVSSVKPFQLMMGKILGIGAVGITQFVLWGVLTGIFFSIVTAIFGPELAMSSPAASPEAFGQNVDPQMQEAMDQVTQVQSKPMKLIGELLGFNLLKLGFIFLFFFIGGYLLYSALFAAVGSAVDSETDTQQLLFPITIPIIISIIIAQVVMQNPNSSMAFWFSIIPLFSPIVMIVRIPFEPAAWEIILSMVLLVAGFIGAVWVAARIYRTGILMYGKKPSFKEIGKWLFYKS